jgi:L-alanine-DL-glutamate epimerase-like enolase superfamily enzyme
MIQAHYQTLKEDVRLVEDVRKAVDDDMEIMVEANQAQSFGHGSRALFGIFAGRWKVPENWNG